MKSTNTETAADRAKRRNRERQRDFKQRQRDAGRVERPYWATPGNHKQLKRLRDELEGE